LRRGLPGSSSTPLHGLRNQLLDFLPIPPACSSFIPLLHHQIHTWNRWFPLTLTFFLVGKCPDSSCARTAEQFLKRSEQKLVDTMIVSDLIHLASTGESAIAVVSSDDDLWPGMLMAMSKGV